MFLQVQGFFRNIRKKNRKKNDDYLISEHIGYDKISIIIKIILSLFALFLLHKATKSALRRTLFTHTLP